jgi:hypothetical protein
MAEEAAMTSSEIQAVLRRYRERLKAILTPEELALYDAYRQRVQAALARRDTGPIPMTPAEQAVVGKIEADSVAAALNKQFLVLIGVEHLPQ